MPNSARILFQYSTENSSTFPSFFFGLSFWSLSLRCFDLLLLFFPLTICLQRVFSFLCWWWRWWLWLRLLECFLCFLFEFFSLAESFSDDFSLIFSGFLSLSFWFLLILESSFIFWLSGSLEEGSFGSSSASSIKSSSKALILGSMFPASSRIYQKT